MVRYIIYFSGWDKYTDIMQKQRGKRVKRMKRVYVGVGVGAEIYL